MFLSFISGLQAFSSYQSDGMLLGAGFISFFFAPPGFRPGWGERHPPSRASWFLLLFEWFTIYFESGIAKIVSGDPEWRHLTAMDDYYQNGPLPTWIAWYAQHLPHWFHVGSGGSHAGAGIGADLDGYSPATLPYRALLDRYALAKRASSSPATMLSSIISCSCWACSCSTTAISRFLLPRHLRQEPRRYEHHPRETAEPPSPYAVRSQQCAYAPQPHSVLSWVFYAMTAQLVWMLLPASPAAGVAGCRA